MIFAVLDVLLATCRRQRLYKLQFFYIYCEKMATVDCVRETTRCANLGAVVLSRIADRSSVVMYRMSDRCRHIHGWSLLVGLYC